MSLEQNLEHIDQMLDRLLAYYKGRPYMEGMLTAFANQIQELEDALFVMRTQRFIDSATGVALDVIGRKIGLRREGRSDSDFRIWIRAEIRANASSGTAPEIIDVLRLLVDDSNTILFTPFYPASFHIEILDALATSAQDLADIIERSKVAGVGASLIYSENDSSETFTFASGSSPEASTTQGFADSGKTTGGFFAGVIAA